MPEIIKLAKLSQDLEERVKNLEDLVFAGVSEPLKFSVLGNFAYLKLLTDKLLEHGLDEVLVFSGGEEVEGVGPGWLPLRGSDLVKALRAYASLGTHLMYEGRLPNWRVYTPWIYTYKGEVFIEWPKMCFRNVYKMMLLRLADASLGEPFTSGIEFEKVDSAILDIFRQRFMMDLVDIPDVFRRMDPADYLRLAGRVSRYAVNLYRETGYPAQTLQPFLPFGTSSVAAVLLGRTKIVKRHGLSEPLGYLRPYDPRFSDLYATISLRRGIYFDPWMVDLDDDVLLKIITSLVANGEKVYEESDGTGVYLLDIEEQREALEEALGPISYRFLADYALERLGEGLYLFVGSAGSRELYSYHPPPPEYQPVMLLGQAFNMGVAYLRAEVKGLPDPLLQIYSCLFDIEDRHVSYKFTLATRPKRIQVKDGIYLDKESGAGIVVY